METHSSESGCWISEASRTCRTSRTWTSEHRWRWLAVVPSGRSHPGGLISGPQFLMMVLLLQLFWMFWLLRMFQVFRILGLDRVPRLKPKIPDLKLVQCQLRVWWRWTGLWWSDEVSRTGQSVMKWTKVMGNTPCLLGSPSICPIWNTETRWAQQPIRAVASGERNTWANTGGSHDNKAATEQVCLSYIQELN